MSAKRVTNPEMQETLKRAAEEAEANFHSSTSLQAKMDKNVNALVDLYRVWIGKGWVA